MVYAGADPVMATGCAPNGGASWAPSAHRRIAVEVNDQPIVLQTNSSDNEHTRARLS
jgi:hypothetical protein